MLIRQGEHRGTAADRNLAWSLAGIAGAINAAGFYAAGLYSSHMTGTVSTMADHLAVGNVGMFGVALAIVATFVAGAMVSTLLINAGHRRGLSAIYAYSVFLEALLLAGLGAADVWLHELRGPALVMGLSFLMGLQNAVVTRISNARVRTTHVTGMITDIGIELGNLLDSLAHRTDREQIQGTVEKLKMHAPTVLSFFAGGVLGVLGYRMGGALLFVSLAVILAGVAAPVIVNQWRTAS
ncbi:YoaK family protein [Azospirillum sp. sgz302134]